MQEPVLLRDLYSILVDNDFKAFFRFPKQNKPKFCIADAVSQCVTLSFIWV